MQSTSSHILHGRYLRHFAARPRLVACIPIVALSYVLTPSLWHDSTRLLIGWNIAASLYILLTARTMAKATDASIRKHAELTDESRFAVLMFCIAAAAACLAAIVAQLGAVKETQGILRAGHLSLAVATIVSAWTFIHLIFAQHYAHEFYILRESEKELPEDARGGLRFPATAQPSFSDFVYYSFVIGCASQTADVETTSRPMRTLTLIHGVISFFFNTTVLALTINISSGLL